MDIAEEAKKWHALCEESWSDETAAAIMRQYMPKCVAAIDQLLADKACLIEERDRFKAHLDDIAEYGTEEINAAVDLRQKIAECRVMLKKSLEALDPLSVWANCADAVDRTQGDNNPFAVLSNDLRRARSMADDIKQYFASMKPPEASSD